MQIIGGVCLLLFGVGMVRKGVTYAFGATLRRVIAKSTSNRIKAFAVGLGVTTVLQSSTAAALIVSSFAGRGFITGAMAIAIMLGADVGTTVIAQILSFNLGWLSPGLLFAGVVLHKASEKGTRIYNIGRAGIGLGLVLLALKLISGASIPIQDSKVVADLIGALDNEPFLAVLISAILTWVVHSSLAMILLLVSLVSVGVLTLPVALPLILGANIGGSLVPLVMLIKADPAETRVPFANLMMRLVGVLCILPVLNFVLPYLDMLSPDPARGVVNFHSGFNILLAVVFLPLIFVISRIAEKAFPDVPNNLKENAPRYLDETALDTPAAALACAARETLRVSDYVERMLRNTLGVLQKNDPRLMRKIRELDDIVDNLYSEIKSYLARVSAEELNKQDSRRYIQILTFSTNLEHIGDIIDVNLMENAAKKIRHQKHFSKQGFDEIAAFHAHIIENMQLAQNVFMSGDVRMARRLFREKSRVRDEELSASASHIQRLRDQVAETIATSSLHLDVLRDFRRINSYLTSIAYPILEEAGELYKSRLKDRDVVDG